MKKTLLIISIVVAVILLGVFVYILFFGTPKSVDDIFTSFSTTDEGGDFVETPGTGGGVQTEQPEGLLSFGDGPFYKITTRPVAGMGFVGTTTLRYAELGTGHIYEVDIIERTEDLVSSKTFQRVRSAHFSPTGTGVVFDLEGNSGYETLVGSLTKNDQGVSTLDVILLPEGAHDAAFTEEEAVSYLLTTDAGTEVHTYNPIAAEDVHTLSLPQQKLRAAWPHHVYTTPTAQLPGYLYDISGDSIQYVRSGALGLTAHAYNSGVLITVPEEEIGLVTYAIEEGLQGLLLYEVVPEKCTSAQMATSTLVCGVDTDTLDDMTFPDDWYKGKTSFDDRFLALGIEEGSVETLFSPADYVRDFDVLRITGNKSGNLFLFIDKNDNSLWFFEYSF